MQPVLPRFHAGHRPIERIEPIVERIETAFRSPERTLAERIAGGNCRVQRRQSMASIMRQVESSRLRGAFG